MEGQEKTLGAKKSVTATIKISWLLFDIMNETFLRGRTIQNRGEDRTVGLPQRGRHNHRQQPL